MIEGKYYYVKDDLTKILEISNKVYHRNQTNYNDLLKKGLEQETIYAGAYANCNPVAMARLQRDNQIFYIDEIAVLEEEQRKGYGDFIVRMLVDKAFTLGGEEVNVLSPSHIKEFFKKIGFKPYEDDFKQDEITFTKLKIRHDDMIKKCQIHLN
jgi:N-acetylglutamate synthase-like GNAT family acetyltransferase